MSQKALVIAEGLSQAATIKAIGHLYQFQFVENANQGRQASLALWASIHRQPFARANFIGLLGHGVVNFQASDERKKFIMLLVKYPSLVPFIHHFGLRRIGRQPVDLSSKVIDIPSGPLPKYTQQTIHNLCMCAAENLVKAFENTDFVSQLLDAVPDFLLLCRLAEFKKMAAVCGKDWKNLVAQACMLANEKKLLSLPFSADMTTNDMFDLYGESSLSTEQFIALLRFALTDKVLTPKLWLIIEAVVEEYNWQPALTDNSERFRALTALSTQLYKREKSDAYVLFVFYHPELLSLLVGELGSPRLGQLVACAENPLLIPMLLTTKHTNEQSARRASFYPDAQSRYAQAGHFLKAYLPLLISELVRCTSKDQMPVLINFFSTTRLPMLAASPISRKFDEIDALVDEFTDFMEDDLKENLLKKEVRLEMQHGLISTASLFSLAVRRLIFQYQATPKRATSLADMLYLILKEPLLRQKIAWDLDTVLSLILFGDEHDARLEFLVATDNHLCSILQDSSDFLAVLRAETNPYHFLSAQQVLFEHHDNLWFVIMEQSHPIVASPELAYLIASQPSYWQQFECKVREEQVLKLALSDLHPIFAARLSWDGYGDFSEHMVNHFLKNLSLLKDEAITRFLLNFCTGLQLKGLCEHDPVETIAPIKSNIAMKKFPRARYFEASLKYGCVTNEMLGEEIKDIRGSLNSDEVLYHPVMMSTLAAKDIIRLLRSHDAYLRIYALEVMINAQPAFIQRLREMSGRAVNDTEHRLVKDLGVIESIIWHYIQQQPALFSSAPGHHFLLAFCSPEQLLALLAPSGESSKVDANGLAQQLIQDEWRLTKVVIYALITAQQLHPLFAHKPVQALRSALQESLDAVLQLLLKPDYFIQKLSAQDQFPPSNKAIQAIRQCDFSKQAVLEAMLVANLPEALSLKMTQVQHIVLSFLCVHHDQLIQAPTASIFAVLFSGEMLLYVVRRFGEKTASIKRLLKTVFSIPANQDKFTAAFFDHVFSENDPVMLSLTRLSEVSCLDMMCLLHADNLAQVDYGIQCLAVFQDGFNDLLALRDQEKIVATTYEQWLVSLLPKASVVVFRRLLQHPVWMNNDKLMGLMDKLVAGDELITLVAEAPPALNADMNAANLIINRPCLLLKYLSRARLIPGELNHDPVLRELFSNKHLLLHLVRSCTTDQLITIVYFTEKHADRSLLLQTIDDYPAGLAAYLSRVSQTDHAADDPLWQAHQQKVDGQGKGGSRQFPGSERNPPLPKAKRSLNFDQVEVDEDDEWSELSLEEKQEQGSLQLDPKPLI